VPIAAKGLNLALGLALLGSGEALSDGLPIHLVGQPRMRTMTWIAGAVTMATRITAATAGSGDRASAKIPKLENLPQDRDPLLFQLAEGLSHGSSSTERIIYARLLVAKKETSEFHIFMSRTPAGETA